MRRLSRTFAAAFGCCAFVFLSLSAQEKDWPQPAVVFKGHAEAVYSASFNKDGTIAVTGSFDKTARLWSVGDGKVVREFGGTGGHTSLVLSATLNGNGYQLATGGSDNTAKVWDVPSAVPVKEFAHGAPVAAMAVSNDGKLAAGAGSDGAVKVWQVADGKLVVTLPGHTGGATGVAFSANGQTLATSGADGRLRFWNTADAKAILAIGAHPGPVNGVAVNPANGATYTIGGDGTLRFWQPNPVAPKVFPPAADAVTTITTAPSGNLTLVGSADKSLRLIDATTGQATKSFAGGTAAIRSAAIFPNGATVGAAMADGNVAIWNGADGKLLAMIPAHAAEATSIAVNAAGNGFATGGSDGIVRTWAFPVVPGKALVHADRILHAMMTADGKRAVTGGPTRSSASGTSRPGRSRNSSRATKVA
jgi:WD40 repeat protein